MAELNPSYAGANPADQFLLDTQKYDTDGVLILSSKRRQSKLETESPIPVETVVGGVWTFYEMEQISDKLVFLVTNTRDVANAPAVKSSKYDENLGQVKITKQLIATPSNTNSVLIPTSKTYYEARETATGPSSVVCYRIVETYSTGIGVDPNPAFPIKTENTVSPELGNVPVVKVSQITTDTSSVGSLTYAGTIGTKITYAPFNQYLRLRVTETWNLFDQNSVEKKQSVIIPEKFKSASAVTETASLVSVSDIVSPITLGTGGKGVVESQSARADAKTIKNTTVTITDPVTPNLTEYSLDNAGQLVTIANNYIDASDAAPSPSALTPVIERQALGGGKAEQKIGTIAQVFDQSSVEKKQSVVIPEKFKSANATTETLSQIVASNATTNIPLGTEGKGVIESQSTRASAFTVKNTTVTITDPVTPNLTEYSLDNAGQLVTILNNYIDASDAAPAPSALTPVIERQALGGGKADQKIGTISQVFDQKSVEKKQSVIIPEKFKSANATTETSSEIIVGATANPIVLGAGGKGVVESQSTRASAFTVKNTTVTITDPVTPNLTEYSLDNAGQLVTIASSYIDSSDAAPAPSALTPVIERQALGGGKADQKIGTISQVFDQSSLEKKQSAVIPEKFKSATATTETFSQIVVGNSTINLPLGTGGKGVVESQSTRASAFTVKNTTVTVTDPVTPSLTEYSLDNAGQLVTISNNYIDASDAAPSPSALTPVIERQALGGGKADQKVGTIAQVFDQKSIEKKQSVIIPDKFKSANATTETSSEIVVGTTANPTALGTGGTGVVDSQSTRASAFTVKNTTVTVTDTAQNLTEYSLDNAGQLITIASSYIDASDAAPAVTALTPVIERQSLGGGKAEQKVGSVAQVFDRNTTRKEYPQVIPQKFLANAIVTESSSVYAGTSPSVAAPSQVTGTIKVESQRIDSTKVQDSITSRTLSLPVNVAGSLRTEHGIATVTDSLVTATQTADPSYLVLSDKVDGLNNGTQTREKVVIDSFPVLSGQLFDKQNDAAIRYTEQIQSAPPLGQTRTEIVPEDFSRSRVRVFDEASIDAAFSDVTTILGLTKVNLPPELISATVIYTGASGSSVSSSSDPVYNKSTPVGTSSNGQLAKIASVGGSIQVHSDLTYVIKEYSSTEVVCTHYFFYVKSGATIEQILTKCGGASQMPLFFPNQFQLVLSGMGVRYDLNAHTQLQVGVSADGGSSDSATKTAGYTLSNEYTTQVTSIPACIRPSTAISIIGSPIITTGLVVAGANTPAIPYGGALDAPAITNSVSTTATATASIYPTTIPATNGTTAIPKSGNYLVELTGNISEYGYNLMHGVVVNFSQYA